MMQPVPRRFRVLRLAAAIAGGTLLPCGVVAVSCGGTTGREDLPSQGTGGSDVDATVELDAGTFDVVIEYTDRLLPDIAPAIQATAPEGGYAWPNCPAFLPVQGDEIVPLGNESNQIPAAYDSDGGIIPAPDGSPCATYGWLGSTGIDQCTLINGTGGPGETYPDLPPCNWCAEAGAATAGPGAGLSRFNLCLNLYGCIHDSGCAYSGNKNEPTCLCGSQVGAACIEAGAANALQGLCAQQELASLEVSTSGLAVALGKDYTNQDNCAGFLNYVFQLVQATGCGPASDGGQ